MSLPGRPVNRSSAAVTPFTDPVSTFWLSTTLLTIGIPYPPLSDVSSAIAAPSTVTVSTTAPPDPSVHFARVPPQVIAVPSRFPSTDGPTLSAAIPSVL